MSVNDLILKILDKWDRYNKGFHDGFEAGLQQRYVIIAAHEKRVEQERNTDPTQTLNVQPGTLARHHHAMEQMKQAARSMAPPTMHELPKMPRKITLH